MSKLFNDLVYLEPEKHQYWHKKTMEEYESLSRVRAVIKEKFNDKQHIYSAGKGDYVGMSPEEVKSLWNKWGKSSTDIGTLIHEALERYEKTAVILPQDEYLRPMILSLTNEYKDYYQVHQEVTLYDEEYKIAGTADHIIETTSSKKSIINIDDYKTCERKGIYFESKYKKYLLGPFSHLQDTNYYDYSLQLSCYAYMLENLTGRKIGTLSIVYIPKFNPLAYKRIPVNYMKNDVRVLFKYYKELKHIKKEEGDLSPTILIPNFA